MLCSDSLWFWYIFAHSFRNSGWKLCWGMLSCFPKSSSYNCFCWQIMCSSHNLIEFLMVKWGLKYLKLLDDFFLLPSDKAARLSGNIQLAEIVLNHEQIEVINNIRLACWSFSLCNHSDVLSCFWLLQETSSSGARWLCGLLHLYICWLVLLFEAQMNYAFKDKLKLSKIVTFHVCYRQLLRIELIPFYLCYLLENGLPIE